MAIDVKFCSTVPCPLNFLMLPYILIIVGTWYTKQCMYGVTFLHWKPSHSERSDKNNLIQSFAYEHNLTW